MRFATPYVLYGALRAAASGLEVPHAEAYRRLLEAIRDDAYDFDAVQDRDVVTYADLPIREVI